MGFARFIGRHAPVIHTRIFAIYWEAEYGLRRTPNEVRNAWGRPFEYINVRYYPDGCVLDVITGLSASLSVMRPQTIRVFGQFTGKLPNSYTGRPTKYQTPVSGFCRY